MTIPFEPTYAYIYDKGGEIRIGGIESPYNIEWNRKLSEYSVARIDAHYSDCGQVLADVEPGRHELVIFRGNERVWEGPIVRKAEQADDLSIHARDVLHYTYRTILKDGYDDSEDCQFIEDRAELILQNELVRQESPPGASTVPPINVRPYITKISNQRTRECRQILEYEKLLYEELEDLSSVGLNFTTVGRRIVLWERTDAGLGTTQPVTDKDFDKGLIITSYGMELATFAAATDGEGRYGWVGEFDDYYGLWEVLDTVRPEGEAVGETLTRDQLIEQARLRLAGRNPTPTRLRVPANSTIDQGSVLRLQDLVCGVRLPVRADFPSRTLVEEHMFEKIQFKISNNREEIQVSTTAAPRVASTQGLDFGSDLS